MATNYKTIFSTSCFIYGSIRPQRILLLKTEPPLVIIIVLLKPVKKFICCEEIHVLRFFPGYVIKCLPEGKMLTRTSDTGFRGGHKSKKREISLVNSMYSSLFTINPSKFQGENSSNALENQFFMSQGNPFPFKLSKRVHAKWQSTSMLC